MNSNTNIGVRAKKRTKEHNNTKNFVHGFILITNKGVTYGRRTTI
tara:strand:- start:5 stop:139 length:135 start_codon:yes stop_codon:yes gene_type:complete